MRNLFQNSLANTKSGYIKIGYELSNFAVSFYVKDSGTDYLKCKEFLQTSNLNESLRKHNDTSTAINLTLAKKLITLMNGEIRIEGNGRAGTAMYFTVPIRQAGRKKLTIKDHNNTNPNTSIAI